MVMWDGAPLLTFSDPLAVGSQGANGCDGGSSGGFICTESSLANGEATGGTFVFNHDLKVAEGTTLLDHSEWSFKALYLEDGQVAAQTSASVPIPSTFLLLGGGFAGLIALRWKQRGATNAC